MARPDDYPAESNDGPVSAYEEFGTVELNVTNMLDYYKEMSINLPADASGPALMEVSLMTDYIMNGLGRAGRFGQAFPEGIEAARRMMQQQADFTAFMSDVLDGIRYMGSAAAVIAETYGDRDFQNSDDLNRVMYAFGQSNQVPEGFREGAETWSQYEIRMRAQGAGAFAMSMSPESQAMTFNEAGNVSVYTFTDGSSRTERYGPGYLEISYYDSSGQLVQRTTETTSVENGNEVRVTTVLQGTEENGTTTVTTQERQADGDLVIQTDTRTVMPEMEPIETHTTVEIEAGARRDPQPDRGPMQTVQEDLDTRGMTGTQQEHGMYA
jgi:hypothetical protein